MHLALKKVAGRIDAVYYCPHIAEDNCECRKPKNKMVTDIGKQFNIDLKDIPAIGDTLRDLQAFASAGCQPMLVRTGKGKTTLANGNLPPHTIVFDDLAAAVQHITDSELST
jgi:D-glycero-D-manno-heptose 1,7-bisphosphate phosphatase